MCTYSCGTDDAPWVPWILAASSRTRGLRQILAVAWYPIFRSFVTPWLVSYPAITEVNHNRSLRTKLLNLFRCSMMGSSFETASYYSDYILKVAPAQLQLQRAILMHNPQPLPTRISIFSSKWSWRSVNHYRSKRHIYAWLTSLEVRGPWSRWGGCTVECPGQSITALPQLELHENVRVAGTWWAPFTTPSITVNLLLTPQASVIYLYNFHIGQH